MHLAKFVVEDSFDINASKVENSNAIRYNDEVLRDRISR
jgi:hypothetical protein